ncbi:MAG: glutathione S-transferase family protein [Burkholderiaceae bacterium]|jgi:glutathione S-transferase
MIRAYEPGTPSMKLYIGNKNYSSWSMRPWVLMRECGIEFDEVMVRFDGFDGDSRFKQVISALNPAGKVPVLVDGDLAVWDTLAIAEYVAERFAEKALWPHDREARARARSVCAEMHSGFSALRGACPMNIEASLPQIGALVMRDRPAVGADLQRICSMWSDLLHESGGPMLFGAFSVADAFYAPVVMRIKTYALPVPTDVQVYMDRVLNLQGVRAWIEGALAEQDFRDFEEPYRMSRLG